MSGFYEDDEPIEHVRAAFERGVKVRTMRPQAIARFEAPGEWGAMWQLERWVRSNGWSIGPTDRAHRRGIIFEAGVRVAKWHNLTLLERAQCDAVAVGSNRHGPIVVVRQHQSGVPPR